MMSVSVALAQSRIESSLAGVAAVTSSRLSSFQPRAKAPPAGASRAGRLPWALAVAVEERPPAVEEASVLPPVAESSIAAAGPLSVGSSRYRKAAGDCEWKRQ
jgi:hypothetical protein